MKKTYEKPVLTMEQFDVQDVVTASAPAGSAGGTLGAGSPNWEITGIPTGDVQFH